MKPSDLMIDNLIFDKIRNEIVKVTANMLLDINGYFDSRYEGVELEKDLQDRYKIKYYHQAQQLIKLKDYEI